ncbi:MAG: hypothetical protein HFG02_01755 [Oscillibacter sp.]|nr:hypothetical protein [Oscillibacter sp.]
MKEGKKKRGKSGENGRKDSRAKPVLPPPTAGALRKCDKNRQSAQRKNAGYPAIIQNVIGRETKNGTSGDFWKYDWNLQPVRGILFYT